MNAVLSSAIWTSLEARSYDGAHTSLDYWVAPLNRTSDILISNMYEHNKSLILWSFTVPVAQSNFLNYFFQSSIFTQIKVTSSLWFLVIIQVGLRQIYLWPLFLNFYTPHLWTTTSLNTGWLLVFSFPTMHSSTSEHWRFHRETPWFYCINLFAALKSLPFLHNFKNFKLILL